MKRIILQPEQIIVPSEYELGNESILKIYFKIFDNRCGYGLPPIVVTSSILDQRLLPPVKDYERAMQSIEEDEIKGIYVHPKTRDHIKNCFVRGMEEYLGIIRKLAQFDENGASYLLLDGNHRSAAATLTHQPISALEIQTDDDLKTIRNMVEKGELFSFNREDMSLAEVVISFYKFCRDKLEDLNTLKERINNLTSNGDLPRYMKEIYLRGR